MLPPNRQTIVLLLSSLPKVLHACLPCQGLGILSTGKNPHLEKQVFGTQTLSSVVTQADASFKETVTKLVNSSGIFLIKQN